MFVYSPKRFKGSLSLSENDMQLLQLICNFGFVNDSQLDMLYSIVQHYPTRFFHPILLKWCQYSGLLQKKKKPLHPSSSSVLRNVYIPTKNCRAFLNANGFVLGDDPLVAINSHNEQAIEVVVQGLYTAMFKASAYNLYSAYLGSKSSYRLLVNPERSIRKVHPERDNQINQKNQILLNPEGLRLPESFNQFNQITQMEHPEKTARSSKAPTFTASNPLWYKRHFAFMRSISNTPIDKYLS